MKSLTSLSIPKIMIPMIRLCVVNTLLERSLMPVRTVSCWLALNVAILTTALKVSTYNSNSLTYN